MARLDPASAVVIVWGAVAGGLLLRLLLGIAATRRLVRRSQPMEDGSWAEQLEEASAALGLGRPVRLAVSAGVEVPITCGVIQPVIVLPACALDWDDQRARVVLLHELAHIRRRDCLVQWGAALGLALHWMNPLAWMAVMRLRAERERACDDLVLQAGTRGSEYAGHLLAIARDARLSGSLGPAALAMARPSELEGRLLAILDPRRRRGVAARRAVAAGTCIAGLLVCSIAALRVEARAVTPGIELDDLAARQDAAPAPQPSASPRPTTQPPATGGEDGGVTGGISGGVRDGVAGGVQGNVGDGTGQGSGAGAGGGAAQGRGTGKGGRETSRARTLSAAERENVTQALAGALNDDDPDVRANALHALARMRSPKAFEPLVAALGDKDPDIRQHAAMALGQLDDPRAIPPLTKAISDPEAEVRQAVVFALGQLEAKDAVPALTAALKDSDPDVRQGAAFALGQAAAAAAAPALAAALKDANAEVRQQVAFALGQLRALDTVPALSAALQDANEEVRQQVAFALGQIGDPAAVQALTRALKDVSAEVRQQAAIALGQLADRFEEEAAHEDAAPRSKPKTDSERSPRTEAPRK
jgi:HEAT repeat protein/beta-lactamase regulating signal transducer with metallopeptidase domain